MKCPFCNHPDTRVTDSRESDDGIRRRRECLSAACGRRFTTYERVQVAPLAVVKKDGRREEFSREKVLAGIRRSCAKLPIAAAQIEAVVDDIESALHSRGIAEVPSTELGNMVMERLRELNHVAYVRFASHYRDFVSLEELRQEFDRLATAPRRSPRRAGAAQPPLLPPTELTRLSESAGSRAGVGGRSSSNQSSTAAGVQEPSARGGGAAASVAAENSAPVHIEERRAARRRAAR